MYLEHYFTRNGQWFPKKCFSLYIVEDHSAVIIRRAPTNVTVLSGSEASFQCEVIEKRTDDVIFWKKVMSG